MLDMDSLIGIVSIAVAQLSNIAFAHLWHRIIPRLHVLHIYVQIKVTLSTNKSSFITRKAMIKIQANRIIENVKSS
jgi:hypothetical protein